MPVADPTSGLVIEVSTVEELADAYRLLSNTVGGGRIELTAQAEGMVVDLRGGGDQPVHITSEDPDNPVTISKISLREIDNVKVSHFHVDNTGENWAAGAGISVREATHVEISNVTFESFADGEYDPADPETELAPSFGTIRLSHDVTFADNHVSGYYQGITLLESTGVDFLNNTFTEMQGDGIRMGGVQDIQIEGNHFHDFYGTVHSFNHNDMIQLWSTNAELVSGDITITGNIFNSGAENGTQTIFMRNEMYDQGWDTSHIYTNIEITDNLIYNSHSHGITVNHADGVTVSDNTVLWNQDGGTAIPRINLSTSWNVTATNNLSGGLNAGPDAVVHDNVILNYNNTSVDNYVANHIINPFIGSEADLLDLQLRPDSEHAGTGSQLTDPMLQSDGGVIPVMVIDVDPEDPQTLTFDAGFSVDESGFASSNDYVFEWVFADGTVQTGPVVTQSFADGGSQVVTLNIVQDGEVVATDVYNIDVADSDLLHIDPDQGFLDLSGYDSILSMGQADLVTGAGGTVIEIGGTEYFSISSNNAQLHGLQSFGLSIELSTTDINGGAFLRMGSTFTAEMASDGSISFRLITDEGSFTVDSGLVTINDGQMHTISFSYSNEAGHLVMLIDGEVVDEVAASGTTPSNGSSSLVVGSPWHEVLEAQVGEIYMSTDPDAVRQQTDTGTEWDLPKAIYDLTGPLVQVTSTFNDGLQTSPMSGPAAEPTDEPITNPAVETVAETATEADTDTVAEALPELTADANQMSDPALVGEDVADAGPDPISRLADVLRSDMADASLGVDFTTARAFDTAAGLNAGASRRVEELVNEHLEEDPGQYEGMVDNIAASFGASPGWIWEVSDRFRFETLGAEQGDAEQSDVWLPQIAAASDGFGGLAELFLPAVSDVPVGEDAHYGAQDGMLGAADVWL